jgi:hypothetical protein
MEEAGSSQHMLQIPTGYCNFQARSQQTVRHPSAHLSILNGANAASPSKYSSGSAYSCCSCQLTGCGAVLGRQTCDSRSNSAGPRQNSHIHSKQTDVNKKHTRGLQVTFVALTQKIQGCTVSQASLQTSAYHLPLVLMNTIKQKFRPPAARPCSGWAPVG